MDYRLTEGDEIFWPCDYCGEFSLAYCEDDDKYLCGEHYEMHSTGDPWLELVELVMETRNEILPQV